MKRLAAIVGGIALVLAVPATLAQGALDGKKYVGEIGDVGKAADEKDAVFTFAEGSFRSSVCDKYGFERGAYTATKDGDAIRFEARTMSTEYGTNAWRGTVKGGSSKACSSGTRSRRSSTRTRRRSRSGSRRS